MNKMPAYSAALLEEIDRFLEKHSMPYATFGKRAMNDPAFVLRLRRGQDVTGRTMERVRAYMRDHSGPLRRRRTAVGMTAA